MAARSRLPDTAVSGFSRLKVVAGPAITVEGISDDAGARGRRWCARTPRLVTTRPSLIRSRDHTPVQSFESLAARPPTRVSLVLVFCFWFDVGLLDFETRVFGVLCEIGWFVVKSWVWVGFGLRREEDDWEMWICCSKWILWRRVNLGVGKWICLQGWSRRRGWWNWFWVMRVQVKENGMVKEWRRIEWWRRMECIGLWFFVFLVFI